MAEFVEVMKQKTRMCKTFVGSCHGCPLEVVAHYDKDMSCGTYIARYPKEAEKIVLEWAAAHPEPRYPSWDEAWKQLFPDSQNPDAPCLKYMLPSNHPQMCSVSCCECTKRPIPADIAEKLGIKPLEE